MGIIIKPFIILIANNPEEDSGESHEMQWWAQCAVFVAF